MAASLAALLLLLSVGCARSGSFLAMNPRRNSLREQLSRLEFKNKQLNDELAVAQEESRRMANDLQLAELDNQNLERRVDSFRTQLGMANPGSSSNDSLEVARPFSGDSSPEFRSTRPIAQPPSRAPFTRIPNSSTIDVTPPPGPSAEDSFGSRQPSPYEEQTRPILDTPPVQYFDLSPSVGRSPIGLSDRSSSSTWEPLARGLSNGDRDYR